MASPYFDKVRSFSQVKNAKEQVQMRIEDKSYTTHELRQEFCKIVNDYEVSSSRNSEMSRQSLDPQPQFDFAVIEERKT